jgi:hypothetical protein
MRRTTNGPRSNGMQDPVSTLTPGTGQLIHHTPLRSL